MKQIFLVEVDLYISPTFLAGAGSSKGKYVKDEFLIKFEMAIDIWVSSLFIIISLSKLDELKIIFLLLFLWNKISSEQRLFNFTEANFGLGSRANKENSFRLLPIQYSDKWFTAEDFEDINSNRVKLQDIQNI